MKGARLLVVAALLGLAGCGGEGITYEQDVEDLAKKIVADWQAVPGVAAAKYSYEHGTDLGQSVGLDAAISPAPNAEDIRDQLVEIARRDYWQSTASATVSAGIYVADELEDGSAVDPSAILFNGDMKLDPRDPAKRAELDEKYGPKPDKK